MTRTKDKRKKEPRLELLYGGFLIRTVQTLRDDCNEEIADEMFGKEKVALKRGYRPPSAACASEVGLGTWIPVWGNAQATGTRLRDRNKLVIV